MIPRSAQDRITSPHSSSVTRNGESPCSYVCMVSVVAPDRRSYRSRELPVLTTTSSDSRQLDTLIRHRVEMVLRVVAHERFHCRL